MDKLAPTTALALSQIIDRNEPLQSNINIHGDELAAVLFYLRHRMPKGVMLTHNNILASERAYCARLNLITRQRCVSDACATGPGYTRRHRAPQSGRVACAGHLLPQKPALPVLAQQLAGAPVCQARRRLFTDICCAVEQRRPLLTAILLMRRHDYSQKGCHDCQQRGIKYWYLRFYRSSPLDG